MNKDTTKKNGGRTEGSFSFAKIKMSDLCSKFNGDTEIVVSAQFAMAHGFTNLVTGPASQMLKQPTKPKVAQVPEISPMAANTDPVTPTTETNPVTV